MVPPTSYRLKNRSRNQPAALKRGAAAVADQMLISATNFLTMVLVARASDVEAFGSFTLGYAVLWGLNSIQAGLITQPHNVLGTTRRGRNYRRYTTTTLVSQLALGGTSAALMLLVALGGYWAGWESAPLVLALGPALFGWQLQEFVRRVFYTEGWMRAALINDVVAYGGQSLLIALLWYQGTLTGPRAMWVVAGCSGLAGLGGLLRMRHNLVSELRWSDIVDNWHFGKWLAAGNIVTLWFVYQLFLFLAAAILGAAAAGILRAAETLFGPTRVLSQMLITTLPIRFARTLTAEGQLGLQREVRLAMLLALPILGTYCLLAAIFAGPLLALFYGDKYASHSSVLVLIAIETFLTYVAMIIDAALRSQRQTRQLFRNRIFASVLALPLGLILIPVLGVHGAVLATIAVQVSQMFLFWRTYRLISREALLAAEIPPPHEKLPVRTELKSTEKMPLSSATSD